jgi:hypothetical protein
MQPAVERGRGHFRDCDGAAAGHARSVDGRSLEGHHRLWQPAAATKNCRGDTMLDIIDNQLPRLIPAVERLLLAASEA